MNMDLKRPANVSLVYISAQTHNEQSKLMFRLFVQTPNEQIPLTFHLFVCLPKLVMNRACGYH